MSLPPVDTTILSSAENLTLVTWLLWPLYDLNSALGATQGYLKSFTLPKSSPVARTSPFRDLATVLMSV